MFRIAFADCGHTCCEACAHQMHMNAVDNGVRLACHLCRTVVESFPIFLVEVVPVAGEPCHKVCLSYYLNLKKNYYYHYLGGGRRLCCVENEEFIEKKSEYSDEIRGNIFDIAFLAFYCDHAKFSIFLPISSGSIRQKFFPARLD